MAATMRMAFSDANAIPSLAGAMRLDASDSRNDRNDGYAMVDILFMAQVMRRPLQALARRWYCRSLFRATRGRRHCAECTRA